MDPTKSISQFLTDTNQVFVNGYGTCAELLVSTMLSDIGTYDLLLTYAKPEYTIGWQKRIERLQQSYLWIDLFDLSTKLRASYLYRTTYQAYPLLGAMSDEGISDIILTFKREIVHFVTRHKSFLAYCDMEQCGVFLWANGYQALNKEDFLAQYDNVYSDLTSLYASTRYRVPKVYLSIFDKLQYIIDVRNRHGEDLIIPPSFREIPKLSTLTASDTRIILSSFQDKCPVNELKSVLYLTYMHMIPIYIMSTTQWMFTMHGQKEQGMTSLVDLVTPETLEFVKQFKACSISSASTASAMKRCLVELPLMKRVFTAIEDTSFFSSYTDIMLGETPITIIGNLIRVYLRNVDLLVLSDMLFSGFYASLNNEHQVPYKETSQIVNKAEKDLARLLSSSYQSSHTQRIMQRYLKTLRIALKKVKRYQRLSGDRDDEDEDNASNYMHLLFGDVTDNDGHPLVCAICLESSEETRHDTWLPLGCNHLYHCDCLDRLAKSNNSTCPLCRTPL